MLLQLIRPVSAGVVRAVSPRDRPRDPRPERRRRCGWCGIALGRWCSLGEEWPTLWLVWWLQLSGTGHLLLRLRHPPRLEQE